MNKREILEIIDSTASFNAYIEGMDTLNGQSLDLVMQVAGVDGEEWTDEECLEIIKEIRDHTNHYRNTHDWEDQVSDYRYAVDPAFDDNSEWVSCDTCEREYDRKEYNSDTCVECENELTIKEREGKK